MDAPTKEDQMADMCRQHGETLQRVGSALGLPAGADLHRAAVAAIEALKVRAASEQEAHRRIYDLLLNDDGQAQKEARKYLERSAPELAGRLTTMAQPMAERQLNALNDDLIAILGRPNFTCIRLAQALRLCGVEIKTKAEHEQAAVIHFLLVRYLRHGSEWATHSDADLRAMLDQVEAKNKAAMGAPETGEGDAR